jgi:hypothetical protein
VLDKCYNNVKTQTEKSLYIRTGYACLTTDAWTNINNEPIINYMIGGNGDTIFLESKLTGEQSHTGQFIAKDLARVIDDLESKGAKISGAVTDNASANKAAWSILHVSINHNSSHFPANIY